MEDLSLHIMDIIENALRAGAKTIRVRVVQDNAKDELSLTIEDDGKGMDERKLQMALDPFYTTKDRKRIGLGLPLLAQAATDADGRIEVDSIPGGGTSVTAVFKLSHPDRKPLGDIDGTIEMMRSFHRDVKIEFEDILKGDNL
jgi:signal transduction histidine kinase